VTLWCERDRMRPQEGEPAFQRASVWPAPTEGRPREARPPGSFCYLLDVDTDLAEEFDPRMRMVVRQIATVAVLDAPLGECRLWARFGDVDPGLGLLVLDGVIAVEVHVMDRTATELVGAGDLLQPWEESEDDLIPRECSWHVLAPARLAVLDAPFAERVRPWPQLTYALLRRSARRARDLGVQRAITSHPRLEVRLALMLWHLATRWGRVEPGGIHLTLPLTHRLLGQLVGAERPSVSHALARLVDGGLLTGGGADWHLRGTSRESFEWLVDRHLHREGLRARA
jgi:CRP/FNR family cyclic AMP-dependent transcriptional regulator